MKKLIVTALATGMIMLTSTTALAAEPAATFVCPNRNTVCVSNGACINNGSCVNNANCTNRENCPNGGTPKRDGSGYARGGQGRGMGKANRNCVN